MQSFQENSETNIKYFVSSTEMIPSEIQEDVKAQYNALLELLRHFWSCFPVSSKFLEEKVCFSYKIDFIL